LLAGLSHPNITCATESGNWQGVSYLVMEDVEGQPLNTSVRQHGAVSIANACELVRQASLGMQHLHEKKCTHRDLKPSNLMLTPDGVVKILDLGMARLMDIDDPEERLTSIGDVMGTPDYMAPEQWQDSSIVDIRGIIYSPGCTLYCLLPGASPFVSHRSSDPVSMTRAHSSAPIPDVQRILAC
jgi:eukaryotic-like serine/threonine-protein kinase